MGGLYQHFNGRDYGILGDDEGWKKKVVWERRGGGGTGHGDAKNGRGEPFWGSYVNIWRTLKCSRFDNYVLVDFVLLPHSDVLPTLEWFEPYETDWKKKWGQFFYLEGG